MSFQPGANLYTQGFGSRPENVEIPHVDTRSPNTRDINYPIGKWWLNKGASLWYLISLSSGTTGTTANWVEVLTSSFGTNTASGTTSATLNGRSGIVTITTPTIAAGGTATMTITNSSVTGAGTQILYSLEGGTTGSALTIQSVTNSAGQSVVVVQNGTGATTNTASLTLTFLVLN